MWKHILLSSENFPEVILCSQIAFPDRCLTFLLGEGGRREGAYSWNPFIVWDPGKHYKAESKLHILFFKDGILTDLTYRI